MFCLHNCICYFGDVIGVLVTVSSCVYRLMLYIAPFIGIVWCGTWWQELRRDVAMGRSLQKSLLTLEKKQPFPLAQLITATSQCFGIHRYPELFLSRGCMMTFGGLFCYLLLFAVLH